MGYNNTKFYNVFRSTLRTRGGIAQYGLIDLDKRFDEDIPRQLATFGTPVYTAINDLCFYNNNLTDASADRAFKKIVIAKITNKSLKYQTIDATAIVLSGMLEAYRVRLDFLYANIENILNGVNTGSEKTTNGSENRAAMQDLPQNEVNIDLNDDTFAYATNNAIGKASSTSDRETVGGHYLDSAEFKAFTEEINATADLFAMAVTAKAY